MMNTHKHSRVFAATSLAALACLTHAQGISTVRIATGLSRPVYVTAARNDFTRLFAVEQRSGSIGRIRIINLAGNTLNATPFLSISGVSTGGEQGLLGLALHPNFMSNGYFYVNYTRTAQAGVSAGSTIVARYRATGGVGSAATADPASAVIVMTILQSDANHNGGWMSFGPDDNLWIATGDGGSGNDTNGTGTVTSVGHTAGMGNAQDVTNNLLGKMLRIDVDGPDNIPGNADDADPVAGKPYRSPATNPFNGTNGDREIWAYGLRNPWRNSFDRATGDLWIADVGQNFREEVNCVDSSLTTATNFGWRCMEGRSCTGLLGCTCNAPSLYLPLHEYSHDQGRCSVTGGVVYRGCAMPSLRGSYFFADYCGGQVYTLTKGATNQTLVAAAERTLELEPPGTDELVNIVSFGEDALGEVYICDLSGGRIYKIVETTFSQPDCNINRVADACDIARGTSTDLNANAIPDECEAPCYADFNQDGGVDGADVEAFFINWSSGSPTADVNQSGGVDGTDVEIFFIAWSAGAC